LLTVVLLLPMAARADAYGPDPSSDAVVVPVGGKDYLLISEGGVVVPLVGPGTFYGFARAGFAPGEEDAKAGVVVVEGLRDRVTRIPLNFEPSGSSTWDDGRPGVPSAGRRFEVYVPEGRWNLRLSGDVPAGGILTAVLYYDGPPQPGTQAARATARRESPWRYRNSVTVEVIYDDNILTQNDESIDPWVTLPRLDVDPRDYRVKTYDDMIIAPQLDLAAERKLIGWGKTRFRFKVKRWMYTQNPIKTNTDLDFGVRQYFGGGKSLELNYQYAPEQYIRQLGDREPFSDPDLDSEAREFRFTRNVATATWRHFVTREFSYFLLAETNRRYYNKPFIENDVEAWEVRGQVAYRFFDRDLRVSLDYSYEVADGRGHDTVGETAETSDDGDPSYERDLYRVGLDLDTPWAAPLVDDVGAVWLFMDYYYTTEKDIFEAPFQRGRRDKWSKIFFKAGRALSRDVDLDFAFVYSERIVESPWYGDITLDKEYIQHRYELSLSYDF
jgi:hypothetical protein